ncbi:acyltransferase family protein [Mycobacteroides abscessus]|uniref:acyltransferase family protein n=1 Tax=Mycobacteroides abscessus TaxID=36809 RepID=UPI0005DCAAA8|nr:acyltransferase family protein [Mycobacteroides abscessus]CPV02935.1 Probable acyltransferase [Mycobacteroides abscessus]
MFFVSATKPTKDPEVSPAAAMDATPKPKGDKAFYRYDLDGLRGIAIFLVAVFHVWFGRVSGGVDVFLTLSGFFYGSKLLRTATTQGASLNPVPVVKRLVRRLLPALILVLAACAVLTVLVQPETRWETFAEQSLASLGYYQNWELANTAADYLAASESVSPLQHLWSMSVQGQFYVGFLALVYLLAVVLRKPLGRHIRTVLIVVIAVLSAASFGYAIYAHLDFQSIAYYNTFARAWELLLGVLVGALVAGTRWPIWLRQLLSFVAVVTILSCGALINGVREFPGPLALVPVVATLLLILSAANLPPDARQPAANRFLATRPLVELGALAYSLYLWHWPLLVYWLVYTGEARVTVAEGAAILGISLALAYLTNKYVETPLRYPRVSPTSASLWTRLRRPTLALGTSIVLMAVALTATSFTWLEHVTVQRSNGKELSGLRPRDYPGAGALLYGEASDDLPITTEQDCISDFRNRAVITCTYGNPHATRTIALAGGSHAEHWITALDILGRQHNFKITTYLKMGCPLSTEEVPRIAGSNDPYPDCKKWVDEVMSRIIQEHPDYVFTTTTRPRSALGDGDVMPESYLGIWSAFDEAGIPVLGMRDTPWLIDKDGTTYTAADCISAGGNADSCAMDRNRALDDVNPTLAIANRFPLLKILDMTRAICRPDKCRAVEGNVLVYHDSHHISATYMRTMAKELGRQIALATGWWRPAQPGR